MTAEEFIKGIKQQVVESTVRSVRARLTEPSTDRSEATTAQDLSSWYLRLSPNDWPHVDDIIRLAASSAVFGFCCVIDGVRVIESTEEKSEFKLVQIAADGMETVLNPIDGEMLHDIFNAVE